MRIIIMDEKLSRVSLNSELVSKISWWADRSRGGCHPARVRIRVATLQDETLGFGTIV
jgi:hypothetical protein